MNNMATIEVEVTCPYYNSNHVVKNGKLHSETKHALSQTLNSAPPLKLITIKLSSNSIFS